ncbi:class I SAM-dependent methyltransferase [Candidatus Thorarchaeota archaeon]|nr:MAG: class I SAM-dependent methyltransferase [Candidatus Thorarchaeota archaeon]
MLVLQPIPLNYVFGVAQSGVLMPDREWVSVPAPEGWMAGWGKVYKELLDTPEEELRDLNVSRVPRELERALKVAEINPSALDILELASGDGSVACYLAKLGATVEALDALEIAVEVTRRRAKALGLEERLTARLRSIDGWDIPHGKYDVIVALQCLQYLFDRAIPRTKEILEAIKPGGFFVYSGNILPHFETDPPIRFITREELQEMLEGWTLHSFGEDEILLKKDDLRGYIWVVARKPIG